MLVCTEGGCGGPGCVMSVLLLQQAGSNNNDVA